tara:strand:- start:810 stop:1181 length:372 start_codon:yes stop_codon:yes gene_type:complete
MKSNRSFGVLFFIVLFCFAIFPVVEKKTPNIYLLILSLLFLILGLYNSKILTPLKKIWIKFGNFLGIVISPIVMFIIYFFMVFTTKIFLRIFNKDILSLKITKKNNTYWIDRKNNIVDMNKQF